MIKLFGIEFDCGAKSGVCMGEPCLNTHTQKCCITCDLIDKCDAPCLVAREKIEEGS